MTFPGFPETFHIILRILLRSFSHPLLLLRVKPKSTFHVSITRNPPITADRVDICDLGPDHRTRRSPHAWSQPEEIMEETDDETYAAQVYEDLLFLAFQPSQHQYRNKKNSATFTI